MYTITTEAKKIINGAITANNSLDIKDKDLFLFSYKEYKEVAKKDRHLVTKELNLYIETKVESINIQNAIKRVLRVAYKYVDMQVISNFDKLEFTNIRGLVNLFTYIDKNYSDKSKEIREKIKSLHTEDMSTHRYNNLIVDNIKELKATYQIVETTEGNIIPVSYTSIVSSVQKLSTEDKVKLLALLTTEVA